MKAVFRSLSLLSLALAIVSVAGLLIFDGLNQLRLTPLHQQTGALAFVLIGSSLIWLQLSSKDDPKEKLKQMLLGLAFVFWGGETICVCRAVGNRPGQPGRPHFRF